jgi:HTH-type transcriptional regulator/antitoxin MqsA
MFGGGVNAFSRYEKGRAKPPLALVKLLWVLNRHPNLLKELKSIDDLGMGNSTGSGFAGFR